jgi:hypothetical protein
MLCSALAVEAARDRQGAMPTDFVDGSDRSTELLAAAGQWRIVYNTFVGLGAVGSSSESASLRRMRSSTVGSSSKRLARTVDNDLVFG